MPNLYVIAGCNGAGETTTSFTVLPEMLNCKEFVNADEIARGLSPFQPETVSFQAGKIMLKRIRELLQSNVDFGFETTLATRSYVSLLKNARLRGYTILLVYFWLESVELSKSRVLERVRKGGHSILPAIIERRYYRGLKNFFTLYLKEVDSWVMYDNSHPSPDIIVKGVNERATEIYNRYIWLTIQSQNEPI